VSSRVREALVGLVIVATNGNKWQAKQDHTPCCPNKSLKSLGCRVPEASGLLRAIYGTMEDI